jgi:hypothetical protein
MWPGTGAQYVALHWKSLTRKQCPMEELSNFLSSTLYFGKMRKISIN